MLPQPKMATRVDMAGNPSGTRFAPAARHSCREPSGSPVSPSAATGRHTRPTDEGRLRACRSTAFSRMVYLATENGTALALRPLVLACLTKNPRVRYTDHANDSTHPE